MEDLFSTHIAVNNKNIAYHVIFDHDEYVFRPADNAQEFSFKREHDEWHNQGPIDAEVRKQAIDALEKYLLRQH